MTEVINIDSKANIPHVNEITNPPKIVDPKLPINDLSQSGYEEIPVNIPEENVAHQVTVSKSAHPVLLKEIGNDNPIEILHLAKSAVISQWIDKHVFLSGCEPSIRYVVNIVTHAEEKKKFFNCRELHNCGDGREFTLQIDRDFEEQPEDSSSISAKSNNSVNNLKGEKANSVKPELERQDTMSVEVRDLFATVHRSKMFWSCCRSKPEIVVKRLNPERKVGSIKEPDDCYSFVLNIADESDKDKYCVNASWKQCGVSWRSSTFGKCYEVFFPIFKAGDLSKEVGLIHKKHTACQNPENEVEFKHAEAVEVIFPKDATNEDKFILICTALTIDYRFYEENPNEVESEAKME